MASSSRHRDLLIITGYVFAVLLIAAVLTPPVFFAAQKIISASPGGFLDRIIGHREFPAYFNRVALVAALVGLWPVFRLMRINREQVVGIQPMRNWGSLFLMGFIFATGFLLIMGATFIQLGAYRMHAEPKWLNLLKPMISALAVGTIEEFLFRGAILGILCRSLGARSGLWWTTVIFAVVHFLKPPADGEIANENVGYMSGFWVVTRLFRGFGEVEFLLEEFLTLMAVGWVTGQVRLKTGSLWASIGLHAGWVFGLKYFGGIKRNTKALSEGEWIPWIGDNLKVGLAPFAVVLLTGFIMLWWAKRYSSKKDIAGASV